MKTNIHSEQVLLPPYMKEDIYARIEQSKRDSAAGLGQESEDMFRELEDGFAKEDTDFWNCRRNPKNLVSNIMKQ